MSYKFNVTDTSATYVAGFRGASSTYIVVGDTSLAGEQGVNLRSSSGQAFIALGGTVLGISATSGANTITLSTGGTEKMRLTNAGRLLLGTTTESTFLLDVNGTARVSGNLTVTGVIYTDAVATRSGVSIDFRDQTAASIMYLDATNKRVGIGTTSPAYTFHAVSSSTTIGAFRNSGAANGQLLVGNSVADLVLRILSTGDSLIHSDTSKYLAFGTNGPVERVRITDAGNLLVGTTADAGFKLDVNGTARVSGALTISSGTTSPGTFIGPGGSIRYTSESGVNTNAVYCSGNTTTQDVIISYVGGNATSNINSYIQTSGYIGTKGGLRLGAASGTDVITALTNTWLNVAAGTTARSQINLASSTAPTSPNNGDIWFDGTDLKMRIGGVTKTFTLV
jgi:hypothetical protein